MSKSHTQRTRIHPHKACQKSVFLRAQLTSAWTTNELMQQSLKKSTCFFTSWCAAAAAKHTRAKLCALKIPPSSQLQRSKLATALLKFQVKNLCQDFLVPTVAQVKKKAWLPWSHEDWKVLQARESYITGRALKSQPEINQGEELPDVCCCWQWNVSNLILISHAQLGRALIFLRRI